MNDAAIIAPVTPTASAASLLGYPTSTMWATWCTEIMRSEKRARAAARYSAQSRNVLDASCHPHVRDGVETGSSPSAGIPGSGLHPSGCSPMLSGSSLKKNQSIGTAIRNINVASVRYAFLHPHALITRSVSGVSTSTPTPVPASAIPIAVPRRPWAENQRDIMAECRPTLSIAMPSAVSTPYAKYSCHRELIWLLARSAIPIVTPPTVNSFRAPHLSWSLPTKGSKIATATMLMEYVPAIPLLLHPKSLLNSTRKTEKVRRMPKTTARDMKATATMTHP